MKFTVTYWQHQQVAAVAEEAEVLEALRSYIDSDPGESYKRRAASAAVDIGVGREPSDTGIIALALREASFEAPEGTEPDSTDENTDYTADVIPV
jgi:hypothetical protein